MNFYTLKLFCLCALLLCASCKDNPAETPVAAGDFAIEIGVNNTTPAQLEQVNFYIKSTATGTIKSVEWNFGDGATAAGMVAGHNYPADGTYSISAKAVNNAGDVAEASAAVTVAGRSLSKALKNFDRSRVWLIAHRCNTGDLSLPENSLSALRRCIELRGTIGLDIVEIDPRMTKDGVPVIMHDASVNRTTNGTGNVKDLTYSQIQSLRLKAKNGTQTDEQVPTVREFLLAAKGKIWIDMDMADKVAAVDIYKVIKECDMLDQVYFCTGGAGEAINSLLSYSPPGIVQSGISGSNAASLQKQGILIAAVSPGSVLGTDRVQSAINAGLAVQSQTLVQDGITYDLEILNNNFTGVELLINKGVNLLQSDYTPLVHTYLKSKGKR
jgi:glycerophosphoryl diester phosphodiesterase